MNKSLKKALSIVLAVLMAVGFVPFVDIAPDTASAAASTWDGSVDTSFSGSGSAVNPYVISSAAELAGLSQLVNNNSNWSKNKHFVLTTDIDLGSREWTPIGIQYTTSGTSYSDRWFFGVFDGNGHVIKNLRIGTSSSRTKIKHAGLFGITGSTARVYNLGIENASIYTQHLHGDDRRGAMVGLVADGGWFFGCYVRNVTVNDSGTCVIGGFAGQNGGTIGYSYAYNVNLSVGGGRKGGFVGDVNSKCTVSHCFVNYYPFVADNDGKCDVCYGETSISGTYGTPSTYGAMFTSASENGGWPKLVWQDFGGLPYYNSSYRIQSAENMRLFSVLGSVYGYDGRTITLENSISLAGYSNWIPIGHAGGVEHWDNSYLQFKGSFNGNGKIISDVTVNTSGKYAGLFADIETPGSVANLGMKNVKITQSNSSDARAGAIVGRTGSNVTIKQCYVKGATVSNSGTGVAGVLTGEFCSGSVMTDCYTANSSATATRAGTVIGDLSGTATRVYCYGCSSTTNKLSAQGSPSNSHYNQTASVVNAAKGTYNAANAWVDDEFNLNKGYIILKWERDNLVFTLNFYEGSTKKDTDYIMYSQNAVMPDYARTGYIHDGFTYTIGGAKQYNGGTSYAMSSVASAALSNGKLTAASDGSKTILNLYASVSPITYTVAYNGNGATDGSTASSSHTYDAAKNLTANGFNRTYTVTYDFNGSGAVNKTENASYVFAGWSTSANGAVVHEDKASVKNLTSTNGATVTLYARWKARTIVLSNATRTGYTFGGWYKEQACTNKVGDAGAAYIPTANTTLYAKWNINSYTVTFKNYDGTVVKTETVNYGGKATQPNDPSRPYDETYHYVFKGWGDFTSDTVITDNVEFTARYDAVEHTYTSSIIEPSTCTVKGTTKYTCSCGHSYTQQNVPLKDHTPVKTDAKSATCQETGNRAYYTCSVCGQLFLDSACTQVTTIEEVTLPKLSHYFTGAARDNGDGTHSYQCRNTGCSEYGNPNAHTYGAWNDQPKATCVTPGKKTRSCSICGAVESQEIPVDTVNGHEITPVAANAATCTTDGNVAYYHCELCGKNFGDIYLTEVLETVVVPATGHDLVHHEAKAATCTQDGWEAYDTCKNCDYTTYKETSKLGHTAGKEVKENFIVPTCKKDGGYDSVYYCVTCGVEISRTQRTIEALGHRAGEVQIENVVKADCENDGSYDEVTYCKSCKEELSRVTKTEAKLGHNPGEVQIENKVEPTCETDGGYDEVVYCAVCNKELSRTPKTDAALGHDLIHHDGKAATCEEAGWEAYDTCKNCDYTTYKEIGALGHDLIHHEGKAATCTETGCADYDTCSRCAYTTYEEIPVDKTNHVATELVNAKKATCTEEGYTGDYKCIACGEITEKGTVIGKLDHDLVHHDAKAATCEEAGWEAYDECKNCDYSTFKEIGKLGHTEGEVQIENVVKADCENDGSYDEVIYCTVCKKEISRVTKTEEKLGHINGEVQIENKVEATCETDGGYDEVIYCTVCHKMLEKGHKTEKALGHDLIHHEGKASTCTEKGHIAYDTCSRCDYSTYDALPIDENAHKWGEWITDDRESCDKPTTKHRTCEYNPEHTESVEVPAGEHIAGAPVIENKKDATCTVNGSYDEVVYCTVCHEEISRTPKTIEAAGHKAGDTVIENKTDATCTVDGSYDEVVYCTVCNEVISRVTKTIEAAGHIEVTVPGKEATCTENGLTDGIKCSKCGETLLHQEVIPASGHHEVEDAAKAATCTETGLTAGKHCDKCDTILVAQEVTPALGHDFAFTSETEATCTEKGEKLYTCTRCDATKTEETPALGHDFGEWIVVKDATETEDGLKRRTCRRCDKFEEEKIPATGSSTMNRIIKFVNMDKMHYVIDNDGEDYIIYNNGAVKWYTDKPLKFTVYLYSNFKYQDIIIKVNGVQIECDENGVYTIPAGTELAVVTAEGAVKDGDDGTKVSFWEAIIRFIKKIISFFGKLFGASSGSDGSNS